MNAIEFETKIAEDNAKKALLETRKALESILRDMDRRIANFENAETTKEKAQILNWTINDMACSVLPNLGISKLADAQAVLAKIA